MVHNYKELEVLTARFPDTERYGLSSQIRRATTSIASNIAEGWGRGSTGDYIQFLTVARGSLMELETHLIVGCNLRFLSPDQLGAASKEIQEIGKMLNGLIGALKSRKAGV